MYDLMDRTQVIVIGWPRSGNTWLSRLLGDMLNSPVTGILKAKPLAEEGLDRPGNYVIRQLHLRVSYDDFDTSIPTAYRFSPPNWRGEHLIHIYRDPRDVAISAMHYWKRETVDEALNMLLEGGEPVKVHGPWIDFVTSWFDLKTCDVTHVSYEALLHDTYNFLEYILYKLGGNCDNIERVIERQSFDNRKQYIKDHPAKHSYNRGVQQHAMWKGKDGTWREFFKQRHGKRLQDSIGHMLLRLGYEKDKNWWQSLPQEE